MVNLSTAMPSRNHQELWEDCEELLRGCFKGDEPSMFLERIQQEQLGFFINCFACEVKVNINNFPLRLRHSSSVFLTKIRELVFGE